jgi:hypothetical protein
MRRCVFPENPVPDHDRLSNLILSHWCLYQPSMVDWLRQEKLLESALEETAERMSDRLYDLISVRKMDHHQAWELAIREFLSAEELSSTPSPSPLRLATSG